MTLPFWDEVECAVCHKVSTNVSLASTNRFGSPDTDLRPPEMERSTIGYWINECPFCGYVAESLDDPPKNPSVLDSDEYKRASRSKFDPLARRFYKKSLLDEGYVWEQYLDLRNAAWACDDALNHFKAKVMRKKALACIKQLLEGKMYEAVAAEYEEDSRNYLIELTLVKFDFLRRATMFEEFEREYAKLLKSPLDDEKVMQVLRFLHGRALEKDDRSYTMWMALADKPLSDS